MQNEPLLSIGRVSELADVPITTLRYYEKRGLIDPPDRIGGQRRYRPEVLMRLMVIRFCRIAGLTLAEIATVVSDETPGRTATKAIAAARIETIDEQLAQLELAKLLLASSIRCRCESVESCRCGAMDHAVDRLLASQQPVRDPSPTTRTAR
ncbi:MAG: MerR family transcriptional regulator [Actinomycetota bacterium]